MSISSVPTAQQKTVQPPPTERTERVEPAGGDRDSDDAKASVAASTQKSSSQPTASTDTGRGQKLSVTA